MIPYESLEKHFTAPQTLQFTYTKIPRKMKKKWKHILNQYPWLEVNQKLWYILELTNPDYKRFLIKQVCNE